MCPPQGGKTRCPGKKGAQIRRQQRCCSQQPGGSRKRARVPATRAGAVPCKVAWAPDHSQLTRCSRRGRSTGRLGKLPSEPPWHSSRCRFVRRVSQEGRANLCPSSEHSRHVSWVSVEHTAGSRRRLQLSSRSSCDTGSQRGRQHQRASGMCMCMCTQSGCNVAQSHAQSLSVRHPQINHQKQHLNAHTCSVGASCVNSREKPPVKRCSRVSDSNAMRCRHSVVRGRPAMKGGTLRHLAATHRCARLLRVREEGITIGTVISKPSGPTVSTGLVPAAGKRASKNDRQLYLS